MKISEVTYESKRVTGQYENDTARVTIQIADGEDVQAAFAMARTTCEEALTVGRDAAMTAKMKDVMATPAGRQAFALFLKSQGK